MSEFAGTKIGADGRRHPAGTEPTDPRPYWTPRHGVDEDVEAIAEVETTEFGRSLLALADSDALTGLLGNTGGGGTSMAYVRHGFFPDALQLIPEVTDKIRLLSPPDPGWKAANAVDSADVAFAGTEDSGNSWWYAGAHLAVFDILTDGMYEVALEMTGLSKTVFTPEVSDITQRPLSASVQGLDQDGASFIADPANYISTDDWKVHGQFTHDWDTDSAMIGYARSHVPMAFTAGQSLAVAPYIPYIPKTGLLATNLFLQISVLKV